MWSIFEDADSESIVFVVPERCGAREWNGEGVSKPLCSYCLSKPQRSNCEFRRAKTAIAQTILFVMFGSFRALKPLRV